VIHRLLPVALFWCSVLTAAALTAAVFLWPRSLTEASGVVQRLYATEVTLRRVTLAGAAGLLCTAFIFFRPTPVRFGQVRRPDGSVPEVNDLAGA
jgi:hypothetical protein